ncbi:MAG: hypothetical protein JWQ25_1845 [Daejeonella sp.]|nr:hypothetical protein [Daejeonella sp.]
MNQELLILIASVVFLVIGVIIWQKGRYLKSNGKKADAVVFSNKLSRTGSNGGVYYPVVRFLTDQKEWITQELSIGYSPAKPEGTKLQVLYDPKNPTNVQVNSTIQLIILPGMFVAIGVVGLVFGTLEYLNILHLLAE